MWLLPRISATATNCSHFLSSFLSNPSHCSQNDSSQYKCDSITLLLKSGLPVASCIRSKALVLVYKPFHYLLFSYPTSTAMVSILPFIFWAITVLNIFNFYIMCGHFLLPGVSPLTCRPTKLSSAYFCNQHSCPTYAHHCHQEHEGRCPTMYTLESYTSSSTACYTLSFPLFVYLFLFFSALGLWSLWTLRDVFASFIMFLGYTA